MKNSGRVAVILVLLSACDKRDDANERAISDSAAMRETMPAPAMLPPNRNDSANILAGVQAKDSVAEDRQLTDANILAMLITADSLEVQVANLALKSTLDSAVRVFADTLQVDHAKGYNQVTALRRNLDVVPQPLSGDSTKQHVQHVMQQMRSAGPAFDTLFAHYGVRDHVHDIAEAQMIASKAQHPRLRVFIQDTVLPMLRKHLQAASSLTMKLAGTTTD